MPEGTRSDLWVREELLQLLSVSGTLAGLSVTVVALMHKIVGTNAAATIIDDLFAFCALIFLTCIYLIFWALRVQRARRGNVARVLTQVVDVLFLVGLTIMTAAGFMMVYTVW